MIILKLFCIQNASRKHVVLWKILFAIRSPGKLFHTRNILFHSTVLLMNNHHIFTEIFFIRQIFRQLFWNEAFSFIHFSISQLLNWSWFLLKDKALGIILICNKSYVIQLSYWPLNNEQQKLFLFHNIWVFSPLNEFASPRHCGGKKFYREDQRNHHVKHAW